MPAHLSFVTAAAAPSLAASFPLLSVPSRWLCQDTGRRDRVPAAGGGREGTGHSRPCGLALLGFGGRVSLAARRGPGLRPDGPLPCAARPQRCPAEAVAVHGDQGAAALGHLVVRAPVHPAGLHALRPGALGLRHAGRGEDPAIPPRVAFLPVQVGARAVRLGGLWVDGLA